MLGFKTKRIHEEWNSKKLSIRLTYIIDALVKFTSCEFGKPVILTEIYRTDEEQKNIYGPLVSIKSVHQYWRAVDIRTSIYTEDEINKILLFLNMFSYDKKRQRYKTALRHDVNAYGDHVHIQTYKTGV